MTEWFARHPEADILCGDALLLDEGEHALSYRRTVAPEWLHTRLAHLSNASCASFYRKSFIERTGVFDTAWRSIGDAEWMAFCAQRRLISDDPVTDPRGNLQGFRERPGVDFRNPSEVSRIAFDVPVKLRRPCYQRKLILPLERLERMLRGATQSGFRNGRHDLLA